MSKKSVFETGMGSRKGYVSKFQTDMSKTDVEKNKKTNKKKETVTCGTACKTKNKKLDSQKLKTMLARN